MMITIGLFEAKGNLGALAQSAAEGEVVVLTRRGRPVAELRAPEGEMSANERKNAVESLRVFRKTVALAPFDIQGLVAEGRR